jgi:hypothetical protein
VNNLVSNPQFTDVLAELRAENDRYLGAIHDSVFYPEGMQGRDYAAYQSDESYPLDDLTRLATKVSEADPEHLAEFRNAMRHDNPCVRYWAVVGCIVLGGRAKPARPELMERRTDDETLIRIQAARALAGFGDVDAALPTIRRTLEQGHAIFQLRSALVVDESDLLAVAPDLATSLKKVGGYGKRVVDWLLERDELRDR